MERTAGVLLIAAATVVGLVDVFALWGRIPAWASLATLSGAGIVLGAGGLMVQGNVSAANWVFCLVGLALLAPIHLRAVFGPPGSSGRHAPRASRA